eukprot:scaffold169473_cov30-Tisochrysis_lutea.AAC.1
MTLSPLHRSGTSGLAAEALRIWWLQRGEWVAKRLDSSPHFDGWSPTCSHLARKAPNIDALSGADYRDAPAL